MCGHREDAEEVAQETLLKVFESIDQLRDPSRLKSWVFRIAKNECFMKRRKSVFAPKAELSLDDQNRMVCAPLRFCLTPAFRTKRRASSACWRYALLANPPSRFPAKKLATSLHCSESAAKSNRTTPVPTGGSVWLLRTCSRRSSAIDTGREAGRCASRSCFQRSIFAPPGCPPVFTSYLPPPPQAQTGKP